MNLTIQSEIEKVLEIPVSDETQEVIKRMQFELAHGHINQKQYKLKILSTILRSEAENG